MKNRTPDSFIKHCENAKAGREPAHYKLDYELTKLQDKFTDPVIINIIKKYKISILEECQTLMNRPNENVPLEDPEANNTQQVASTLETSDSDALELNPPVPVNASTPVTTAQSNKVLSAIYEFPDSPVSEINLSGIDKFNE